MMGVMVALLDPRLTPFPLKRHRVREQARFSSEYYDYLTSLGAFEQHPMELIDGYLVERGDMNDAHAQAVSLTQNALYELFPPTKFTIRTQLPMRLDSGDRPFPDLVVLRGTARENSKHPSDALLVIEVADSTLRDDREIKAEVYAINGIADYWIVNLIDRCLEVHREPTKRGDYHEYAPSLKLRPGESIAPLTMPDRAIDVASLLPDAG